jgi:hypothetical protein
VDKTSATLNGTVSNPHIREGSAHFEFGTSTSYGQTFDAGSLASGASGDPRSQAVSGLSPGTTYHYRMVASNDDDTRFGPDVAFTTPSDPQPGPGPQPQPQPQPRPGPKPHPRRPKIRASRAGASCVRNRFTARISVSVYNSTRVRSIRVTLDGRHLMRTKRRRFSVGIDARRLATGTHVLRVAVTDSAGRRSTFRRLFRRCRPPDRPLFTG